MSDFGNRLKQAREALGWSAEEAANRAGVKVSAYYDWEVGLNAPRFKRLPRISKAFRIPVPEMVTAILSDAPERAKMQAAKQAARNKAKRRRSLAA